MRKTMAFGLALLLVTVVFAAMPLCVSANSTDDVTIESITGQSGPVELGTVIEVTCTFTDQNSMGTHTATIDWGDGNELDEDNNIEENEGSGTVTDSHEYALPGVYEITVTVSNNDGGSGFDVFQYAVVYDSDGGSVTGGGWINSPAGAYAPDTSLTGKATFGFVSKYKKGASVPTGNTEFQFKAGDLNFHSNDYDWLLVAGAKALFKGTGTINGEGQYTFILTATDGDLPSGDVDRLWVQIWNSSGATIYDNESDTALGSGQIMIHKK